MIHKTTRAREHHLAKTHPAGTSTPKARKSTQQSAVSARAIDRSSDEDSTSDYEETGTTKAVAKQHALSAESSTKQAKYDSPRVRGRDMEGIPPTRPAAPIERPVSGGKSQDLAARPRLLQELPLMSTDLGPSETTQPSQQDVWEAPGTALGASCSNSGQRQATTSAPYAGSANSASSQTALSSKVACPQSDSDLGPNVEQILHRELQPRDITSKNANSTTSDRLPGFRLLTSTNYDVQSGSSQGQQNSTATSSTIATHDPEKGAVGIEARGEVNAALPMPSAPTKVSTTVRCM